MRLGNELGGDFWWLALGRGRVRDRPQNDNSRRLPIQRETNLLFLLFDFSPLGHLDNLTLPLFFNLLALPLPDANVNRLAVKVDFAASPDVDDGKHSEPRLLPTSALEERRRPRHLTLDEDIERDLPIVVPSACVDALATRHPRIAATSAAVPEGDVDFGVRVGIGRSVRVDLVGLEELPRRLSSRSLLGGFLLRGEPFGLEVVGELLAREGDLEVKLRRARKRGVRDASLPSK